MSILKDPVRPFDPTSQQGFLAPSPEAETERGRPEPLDHQPLPSRSRPRPKASPADDVRSAIRPRGPVGQTSFELASRGGYVRTVTGTVAYLDEDAQTYVVLGDDGELLRVPMRDITSTHEAGANGDDPLRPERDAEGLGTGQ